MTIKKLPDARFSQEKKVDHQIGASSCVAHGNLNLIHTASRKAPLLISWNHAPSPNASALRAPACPTNPSALLPTLLAFSVLLNLRALYRSLSLTTWDGSASTSLLHNIVGTLFKACRGRPYRRALISSLSLRST